MLLMPKDVSLFAKVRVVDFFESQGCGYLKGGDGKMPSFVQLPTRGISICVVYLPCPLFRLLAS
jgi:hypothetical protein